MMRRLGVIWTASGLLASAIVAFANSAAQAESFQDWSSVAAGGTHTCGIRHGGKLYCWGRDSRGQVGDGSGDSTPVTSPRRVGAFEDWNSVSTGDEHTCGIRHDGKLYCWGDDSFGEVGDGDTDEVFVDPAPKRIGTFEDWAEVSAGSDFTCGVRRNGKLYCWGSDSNGKVGDGEGHDAYAPRRIGSFEDWSTVSAGNQHACGVRKNGKLYCWGSDAVDQIGNGSASSGEVTSPQRIGSFEDWAAVTAGGYHTCGIRHGGKLYCWGYNDSGEVGDGNAPDNAPAPVRIGAFEDWALVSAGSLHTCGVRKNGKLYCWGNDEAGTIGDGDGTGATVPRRIGSFEDWARVSAGGEHSCGVRENHKLYCWGYDGFGEIGDGDPADPTPVTAPVRV